MWCILTVVCDASQRHVFHNSEDQSSGQPRRQQQSGISNMVDITMVRNPSLLLSHQTRYKWQRILNTFGPWISKRLSAISLEPFEGQPFLLVSESP